MNRTLAFMQALLSRDAAKPCLNFALSFRSNPAKAGQYCGWFILPGDVHGRQVCRPDGSPLWRESVAQAEADAGHALVDALQTIKREIEESAAFPRIVHQGRRTYWEVGPHLYQATENPETPPALGSGYRSLATLCRLKGDTPPAASTRESGR